jgi:hypothetical protein
MPYRAHATVSYQGHRQEETKTKRCEGLEAKKVTCHEFYVERCCYNRVLLLGLRELMPDLIKPEPGLRKALRKKRQMWVNLERPILTKYYINFIAHKLAN